MSNAAHQVRDDLRLLRESVRMLFERAGGMARARKIRDEGGGWDAPVVTELAGAGVFGTAVPEEAGGLGMGLAAAGIIAEEAGRVIAPEPVVASVGLAIGLLRRLCPEHALLTEALAGRTVLATAWQERDAKGLSDTLSCRVENGALTGTKSWVAGAAGSSGILVVAEAGGGPALALVEPGCKGVSLDKRRQSDGSTLAELHLSGAPAELLAEGPAVAKALAAAVSETTALTAAELVGVSAKALEMTLDHIKTREQFDKPIGSFQVIQHRAADIHVMQEVAEAGVRDALRLMDATEAPAPACTPGQPRQGPGLYHGQEDHARGDPAAWRGRLRRRIRHRALPEQGAGALGLAGRRRLSPAALAELPQRRGGRRVINYNAMSDADFRREARQFFETEYPEELRNLSHRPKFAEIEHWHRKLHAKGWVAPAWPEEYGGMGLNAAKLLIFYEEQQRWGVVRGRDMGVQMVGPLIIKFGTDAQKAHWLPRILSCEDIWCQGYSEPGAGSDLANLRTNAVIDGDEFVINGQKIWTTMAHDSTHIFMLVRTDPKAPKKQQGISFLLVPMDQPGVEVRTITTLAGETEFCEVFFDEARTPCENLVGELNKGWAMAKSLLSFERVFIGAPNLAQNALGQLETYARGAGRFYDPVFRDRFAEVALDVEDHAALYARFADQLKRGEPLGADVSMLKIWVTETFQKITELMIEAAGSDGGTLGPLQVGNVGVDVLAAFYKARPTTIYGGSNEIQRNILSKAVLGLPG